MCIVVSALVASLAAHTENMQKVHLFPLLVKSFSAPVYYKYISFNLYFMTPFQNF